MNFLFRLVRSLTSFTLRANWNHGLEDSTSELEKLFKNAKRHVRVVAGDLEHGAFNNERVLGAIEEVINRPKRPVTFEILCGPIPDPKTKQIWELAKKSKGRLRITKLAERPKAHFVLVDDKSAIRIEQYHEPNELERRAFRKRGTFFLGNILENDFETLKKSALRSERVTPR